MSSYKNMEEVLKLINSKYVSLNTEEVKHNNERLRATLWDLIGIIKKQDLLFSKLFETVYFGGSYYDDLKVGKPNEFDLDLLLVLPPVCEVHKMKNCGCIKVSPSNKPGYFWCQVPKGYCTALDRFIKDGYIQTDLVLNWLKSNVTTALGKLTLVNSSVYSYSVDPPKYFSESGPALTLQLSGSFGNMDVDLVPAFKFGPENWPSQGFRSNKTSRTHFFIVPKKTKAMSYGERYWRASFQDQEREIIRGKERLKPALRLLKKMRNNLVQSSISSYALKTIVLSDIDTSYYNWNETLSDTFMKLLEKYKECLNNKKVLYYWNKNNNLLDGINPDTLSNHHNEIDRLLKKIKDKHLSDPCIVAKIILKEGTDEYNTFLAEFHQQNFVGNISGMSVRTSTQGSSYYTFEPGATSRSNTLPVQDSTRFFTPSDFSSPGTSTQQTTENSSNGWTTAAILGVGAAAIAGLGILGALSHKRNQNR